MNHERGRAIANDESRAAGDLPRSRIRHVDADTHRERATTAEPTEYSIGMGTEPHRLARPAHLITDPTMVTEGLPAKHVKETKTVTGVVDVGAARHDPHGCGPRQGRNATKTSDRRTKSSRERVIGSRERTDQSLCSRR